MICSRESPGSWTALCFGIGTWAEGEEHKCRSVSIEALGAYPYKEMSDRSDLDSVLRSSRGHEEW